jgi:branched-chain amino acid transport system substrate-binding protein
MRTTVLRTGAVLAVTVLAVSACSSSKASDSRSASSGGAGTSASTEPIRIGAVFDTTGALAVQGGSAKLATEIWVKHINDTGGVNGRKIELVFKDSASTASVAAAAVRDLAKQGVFATLGPVVAGNCQLAAPIAESAKIVEYCLSGSKFTWTPHFFAANLPPATTLGALPVLWMQKQVHATKIGCLATSNQSGDSYSAELSQEATRLGVTPIIEHFASGDVDVSAQVEKLRAAGVQAIALCTAGTDVLTALRGIQQIGVDVPVWAPSGSLALSAQMAKVLPKGGLYGGVQYIGFPEATPASFPNKADIQSFHDLWVAQSKQPLDVLQGLPLDGLLMYVDAFKHGAKTADDVAKHLEGLKNFPGFLTQYTLSPTDHRGSQPVNLVGQVQPDGTVKLAGTVDLK